MPAQTKLWTSFASSSTLRASVFRRCSLRKSRLDTCRRFWSTSSQAESTSPSPTAVESFDVVIVGGGPAGLALASALAASPAVYETSRVALIEAGSLARTSSWSPNSDEFSNRVSSITNASRAFLQEIGVWDHVEESRSMPVEQMQVWDGVSDARIIFDTSDIINPPSHPPSHPSEMARLIENLNLQRAMLRFLQERSDVQLLDNVKVTEIQRSDIESDDWPQVTLSDGRVLRARLLVGADGHNSPVRSYAEIDSYGWSYPTHAIVATLLHPPLPLHRPNTTAYQRFLPTGPIAFLPLSETASSLVWSTRPALAAALKAIEPEALSQLINAAFRLPVFSVKYLHSRILEAQESGAPLTPAQLSSEIAFRSHAHSIDPHSALSTDLSNTVGMPPTGSADYPPLITALQPGSVASFPLRFMHADSYLGTGRRSRTALIGDAAHNIHPLAGQGLNMGLADVQALVRCVEKGIMTGSDIGSQIVLQPYVRARYAPNHTVLSSTDKLHKLYALESAPAVWARSVGLELINELGSVKGAIMRGAGAGAGTGGAERGARKVLLNAAADGVEVVAAAMATVRGTVEGLGALVGPVLRGMINGARR